MSQLPKRGEGFFDDAALIQALAAPPVDEGNWYEVDSALFEQYNAYYSLGQYEKAIEHHKQALAISREIGDRQGEGNHLGNLGLVYINLGQYDEAKADLNLMPKRAGDSAVHLASRRRTGQLVAVKKVSTGQGMTPAACKEEAYLMRRLDHPNVIGTVDAYWTSSGEPSRATRSPSAVPSALKPRILSCNRAFASVRAVGRNSAERVSLSYFNDCSFLRVLGRQRDEELVTYR